VSHHADPGIVYDTCLRATLYALMLSMISLCVAPCRSRSSLLQLFVCHLVDPDLVYDKCLEHDDGFENALGLFPSGYRPTVVQPEMSGMLSQLL